MRKNLIAPDDLAVAKGDDHNIIRHVIESRVSVAAN